MIGYIFGIHHGFYLNTDIEFWTIYVVQFGLFLPFIGMGMIAIGALIGKILNREWVFEIKLNHRDIPFPNSPLFNI